jgi:DNA repair protein SbcC/Rad50
MAIHYKSILIEDDGIEKKKIPNNPDLETLENIVFIEGPNDCGKSTLLNVIALSFYGKKFSRKYKNKFSPSIISEFSGMVSEDGKEDIGFDLTVEFQGNRLEINKERNSQQINRKYNGENLIFEDFENQFDLIYDIPLNPTKRLSDILNDTKLRFDEINQKLIAPFELHLGKILNLVREDPASLKTKKENELKSLTEKEKTVNLKVEKSEKIYKDYKHYFILNKLDFIEDELVDLKNKLDNLKAKASTSKFFTKLKTKDLTTIKSFDTEFDQLIKQIKQYVEEIAAEDAYKTIFGEVKKVNRVKDFSDNKGDELYEKITDLNELTWKLSEDLVDDEASTQVEFLKQLKDILKQRPIQKDENELNNMFNNFMEEIDLYLKKNKLEYSYDQTFKGIIDVIDEKIYPLIEKTAGAYQRSGNEGESINMSDIGIEGRKLSLKKQIGDYRKDKKQLKDDLSEFGLLDEEKSMFYAKIKNKYDELSEISLTKVENLLTERKDSLRKSLEEQKEIKTSITICESMLDELKNQKSSKYSNKKEALDKLNQSFSGMRRQVEINFKININDIIKKRLENPDKQKEFSKAINTFLAKKIPTIEHDGVNYQVKEVDYIEQKFTTDDGREIKFKVFGTGKSQQAALISRLESLDPDKKHIILLDETSHMDEKTIQPIKEKLKDLYIEEKIILGILVKPVAKDLKVTSLL